MEQLEYVKSKSDLKTFCSTIKILKDVFSKYIIFFLQSQILFNMYTRYIITLYFMKPKKKKISLFFNNLSHILLTL